MTTELQAGFVTLQIQWIQLVKIVFLMISNSSFFKFLTSFSFNLVVEAFNVKITSDAVLYAFSE